MLTGKLVRIRYARNRIIPHYLPVDDPELQETAQRMIDLFRGQEGKSRGRLEEDFRGVCRRAAARLGSGER